MHIKIAGALTHFETLHVLAVEKLRPLIKRGWRFTVYDGILCNWSSGRIKRDVALDPEKVRWYNKQGISLSLTFANPVIDIMDPVGLAALRTLSEIGKEYNVKNDIILINPILCDFLMLAYPDLSRTYSITGHPNSIKVDTNAIEYYLALEEKYDIIVPKFEMTFNETFLKAVDVKKYEPIIDDTCVYGCPIFREHLFEMARINREYENPWLELGEKACTTLEECWIPNFNPDLGSNGDKKKHGCQGLGMDIYQPEDLKKFLDVGYEHIKLTGRELPQETFKENMNRNLESIIEAWTS